MRAMITDRPGWGSCPRGLKVAPSLVVSTAGVKLVPSKPPARYTVPSAPTAEVRSARGVGSRPATAAAGVPCATASLRDWESAVMDAAPPPNTNERLPITAPAASCTGTGRDPAGLAAPVTGSYSVIAGVVLSPVPLRPPRTSIFPSTGRATALETEADSCHDPTETDRWGGPAGTVRLPWGEAFSGAWAGWDDPLVAHSTTARSTTTADATARRRRRYTDRG